MKFRKLRDDTRKDAIVYLKNVLPVSMKAVKGIREYFENYQVLTFDKWKEDLKDIIEETEAYRSYCEVLLHMHENILVSLKKKQDQAKIILTEFKKLEEKYRREKEAFEKSENIKKGFAIFLVFIPGVNVIAAPLLGLGADSDFAKAVAKEEEAEVQTTATLVVTETMIPALNHIIDGLNAAAGFFSVMTDELHSFEDRARGSLEKPRLRHYKIMKNQAGEIKSISREFFAMLPGVKTDFEAIPTVGTDQNYVDKWLKQQLKKIEKERNSALKKFLLKAIKGGED